MKTVAPLRCCVVLAGVLLCVPATAQLNARDILLKAQKQWQQAKTFQFEAVIEMRLNKVSGLNKASGRGTLSASVAEKKYRIAGTFHFKSVKELAAKQFRMLMVKNGSEGWVESPAGYMKDGPPDEGTPPAHSTPFGDLNSGAYNLFQNEAPTEDKSI